MYIFDEATSNIDVESENDMLANAAEADNIYVLESGNVAESGCHEELLKQKGVYVCRAFITILGGCAVLSALGHSLLPLGTLFALAAYGTVGIAIPLNASRLSGEDGLLFRTKSGDLAGFVLDSLQGLAESFWTSLPAIWIRSTNENSTEPTPFMRRLDFL